MCFGFSSVRSSHNHHFDSSDTTSYQSADRRIVRSENIKG